MLTANKNLSQQDSNQILLSYIRLYCTEGIGPKTFDFLITSCSTAKGAIDTIESIQSNRSPSISGPKPIRDKILKIAAKINILKTNKAIDIIEAMDKLQGKIILNIDKEYPEILKQIPDAPAILFTKGNITLLKKPMVAMVGGRNCSFNGSKFAFSLASNLSLTGINIVSGMAKGIDKAAHNGAIKNIDATNQDIDSNSYGSTIAVLAGGIDVIYPPECHQTYHDILNKKGLIISEMPPNTQVSHKIFPRRNRIISGLSKGIILIEAGKQSGSLISADFALDYGKEVMVVPGPPYDPRCLGSNQLLKKGACVINYYQDVIDCIGADNLGCNTDYKKSSSTNENNKKNSDTDKKSTVKSRQNNSLLEKEILAQLGSTPTDIDFLINYFSLSIDEILPVITQLEMTDKIVRISNKKIILNHFDNNKS